MTIPLHLYELYDSKLFVRVRATTTDEALQKYALYTHQNEDDVKQEFRHQLLRMNLFEAGTCEP